MKPEEDIYEVNNPYFLSDVFVFQRKRFKSFFYGEIESICYMKLNARNQIEEIGFDFSKRFHLEWGKEYKKATPLHKATFRRFSDAYWIKHYDPETHKHSR